jgi:hypothetical protein
MVNERFCLDEEGISLLKRLKPLFGFGGFGEAVYYRTYSRIKQDGVQEKWADNMVSCTVYFDPETEGGQIGQMLTQFAPLIKSVSMLPHTGKGAYTQMPYEEITPEEYDERVRRIPKIDWSAFAGSEGMKELCCAGGVSE